MSAQLTDLERAVLEKLLAGSHPVLHSLREQLRACRVKEREFTGCGFFCFLECDRSVSAARTTSETLTLGDVDAEISGLNHGAGFVLFVTRGYLDNLEGYSFEEPWPAKISEFTLKYTGGSRDLSALRLDGE